MRRIGLGTFEATPKMYELVNDVLDDGRLSYGPYSRNFEKEFASLHDCQYAVLSNSGTSSLLVALQTLKELHGWQDGDEVIVPAITFVATVNVVLQCGLRPVLVDVEPDYYGINCGSLYHHLASAYSVLKENVRAIIPVHTFGQSADMNELKRYIGHMDIKIIEDSCEAMFVSHHNKPVGSWGDIGCFSTYMAHHLPTGVGGIAITDNPDYARKMRSLVNHGLAYDDLSATEEYDPSMLARKFRFDSVGHSFRITELEAAIGLAQLENWREMIQTRQANAAYLTGLLESEGLDEYLQLPQTRPNTEHSWMMYPLVSKIEGVRDRLMAYLAECGIESRTMLPLTNQPVYRDLFNEGDHPVAKWINEAGYYVGIHQDLSVDDLDYMVEKLKGFFDEEI